MNAFRDIESLLRVISRDKDLLRFLFTGRKAPALRQEQAVDNFLAGDERRLSLLQEHGVVRLQDGVLVLEDTWLRFFAESGGHRIRGTGTFIHPSNTPIDTIYSLENRYLCVA